MKNRRSLANRLLHTCSRKPTIGPVHRKSGAAARAACIIATAALLAAACGVDPETTADVAPDPEPPKVTVVPSTTTEAVSSVPPP